MGEGMEVRCQHWWSSRITIIMRVCMMGWRTCHHVGAVQVREQLCRVGFLFSFSFWFLFVDQAILELRELRLNVCTTSAWAKLTSLCIHSKHCTLRPLYSFKHCLPKLSRLTLNLASPCLSLPSSWHSPSVHHSSLEGGF